MDFLDKHTLNRPLWYSSFGFIFSARFAGRLIYFFQPFFWKKDSGKLIHSFLEGNCIAAMNGMLTVSFVTSTKMCQLLTLQHTISFLKFLFTANLNEATSVSWNTDVAVTFDFTLSCHKSSWGSLTYNQSYVIKLPPRTTW